MRFFQTEVKRIHILQHVMLFTFRFHLVHVIDKVTRLDACERRLVHAYSELDPIFNRRDEDTGKMLFLKLKSPSYLSIGTKVKRQNI